MSTEELKLEIQKLIDRIPEENLTHIYELLKEIKGSPVEKVQLSKNLSKILSEDRELLKKLAE